MGSGRLLGAYFLDVGQGDCSFIVPPDNDHYAVLMDCRDAYVADRFVVDQRIREISVVISHLDRDHIAGLAEFLLCYLKRGLIVREVFVAFDRAPEAGKLTRVAATLLEFLLDLEQKRRVPLIPAFREKAPRTICEGRSWRILLVLPLYSATLAARMRGMTQPNESSAALRVEYGSQAILVGGDAFLSSWERLDASLLPAQVFRVPHHGGSLVDRGASWSESDLYLRISPRLAVISVGTNVTPRYGHPAQIHMHAMSAGGTCRRLCTQLTPRCTTEPERYREQLLREGSHILPYRHRVLPGGRLPHRSQPEVPCAGSVAAFLDGGDQFLTEPEPADWHDRLVARFDSPLCRCDP